MLASLPLWGRVKHAGQETMPDGASLIGNRDALRKRGVVLAVLSFFFYCAAETAVGLWAATYFVSVRGVDPSRAALWGSLFYFGIMGGRMLSGVLAIRVKERVLVNAGLIMAVLGALIVALPLPQTLSLTGFLLFGLGCAPVFPNLIHITPRRFGAAYSQAVIGLQMAAAYLGCTLMPPLVGWAGQRFGFSGLPYYVLACLALLYATILLCNHKTGFGLEKTGSA